MKNRICDMLSKYEIAAKNEIAEKFLDYYEMLVETNKVMNLTAITEFEEVVNKHFSDSISILLSSEKFKSDMENGRKCNIIDIGTGAGFPGIPLKIIYPEAEILLVDSLGKRINFLNNVIEKLALTDISAVNLRAEEAGQIDEYRESFDYCVCRAVAKMNIISEYALPLVKVDGYFIPYKSGDIEDECKAAEGAIKKLGGTIEKISHIVLPETDISRAHVLVRKIKKTDKIYPRNNSKIKKFPL